MRRLLILKLNGVVLLSLFIGCKSLSISQDQNVSQLSMLADDKYSFFLGYSEQDQTYEFLSCLSPVDFNSVDSAHGLADQCVSAFRGVPRKQGCQDYRQVKSVCDKMAPLKQFCDNPDEHLPPAGYSAVDCPYIQPTIEQCAITLPVWEQGCGEWYQMTRKCLDTQGSDQQACALFRQLDADHLKFVMRDPHLSAAERAELNWVLNYQLKEQEKAGDPLRFFGSGAALAIMTRDYGSRIQGVFPQLPKFFSQQIGIGSLKFSLKNLVGFLAQLKLFSVAEQGTESLFKQLGYSPQVGCMMESSQLLFRKGEGGEATVYEKVTPMDTTESAAQTVRDAIMYGGLGFSGNVMVLRLSRGAVAPVRLGAVLVIPFMTLYFSHQQNSSQSAAEINQHFDTIFGGSLRTNTVTQIEDLIKVLGQSLVVASKAKSTEIYEYCLPKPTLSGVEPQCERLLEESDGILYELAYQQNDPAQGVCDITVRDNWRDGF